MTKICLIATGGPSQEASVSFVSAYFAYQNMPADVLPLFLVFKDHNTVYLSKDYDFCIKNNNLAILKDNLDFFPLANLNLELQKYLNSSNYQVCVFQCIHGHLGEDGTINDLFKVFGYPVTGFSAKSSYIAFDKVLTKLILAKKGIPIVPFEFYLKHEAIPAKRPFSGNLFIKPAREGSSIGVFRVGEQENWQNTLKAAFKYDSKLIVEPEVKGRELEVALIQVKNSWVISPIGEIFKSNWYDFEEKYQKSSKTKVGLALDLNGVIVDKLKETAKNVVLSLEGCGFARVDFFLDENMQILVNEINTIPGMTAISMFPYLLNKIGISSLELISLMLESCNTNNG